MSKASNSKRLTREQQRQIKNEQWEKDLERSANFAMWMCIMEEEEEERKKATEGDCYSNTDWSGTPASPSTENPDSSNAGWIIGVIAVAIILLLISPGLLLILVIIGVLSAIFQ